MKLNYVRAGRVVGVHGIRGELKVLPLGQDPAFLTRVHTFYLDGQPLTVAGCRLHKDLALMRLAEVGDRDAALALRNRELYVRRADAPLPPGEFFDDELLGLEVYNGETGQCLGELVKVEAYPASKIYTVRGVREDLIPAVKDAFILSVDLEANRMEVRVWEGME